MYIQNWFLPFFSQDYNRTSYTTYIVCVNFIYGRWDILFKVDLERQIYEKLFVEILFPL